MKKLLLLSALMLTTNIATAAISTDPCDDLAGEWFGITTQKGSTAAPATSTNYYNSQNNQFYMQFSQFPKTATGECRNGILKAMDLSGAAFGVKALEGTINNGRIDLAGSYSSGSNGGSPFNSVTFTLYKKGTN